MGEKNSLGRKFTSLSRSCEKLTQELEGSRGEAGFWESQCHDQEEVVRECNAGP